MIVEFILVFVEKESGKESKSYREEENCSPSF